MGAHDITVLDETYPSLNGSISQNALAYLNSQSLVSVGSMANTLRQFDAYGNTLFADTTLAVVTVADPAKKPLAAEMLTLGMLASVNGKG
jgi:hypothetical protein